MKPTMCISPSVSNDSVREFKLNCLNNLNFYENIPRDENPIKLDVTLNTNKEVKLDVDPDYKELINDKRYYDDCIRLKWKEIIPVSNIVCDKDNNVDIYKQCICKNVRTSECSTPLCKFNKYDSSDSRFNDGLEIMDILSDNLKRKIKEN